MPTYTHGINRNIDEDKAIYHVFVYLIGMDQGSFNQVKDWFKFQGILSLEQLLDLHLLDPALVTDPKYRANCQTRYLDSWVTENFSSICDFAIDILKKHKVPIKARDWLNLRSISDCQKYGLKLHHPPQGTPKSITHVDDSLTQIGNDMSPKTSINACPIQVHKMTTASKHTPEFVVRTSSKNRNLREARAVRKDPNIHPSNEPLKGSHTTPRIHATLNPVSPKKAGTYCS